MIRWNEEMDALASAGSRQGFSAREIADLMGVPRSAVIRRLNLIGVLENDCRYCQARLDGSDRKYCYHLEFKDTHVDGRPLNKWPRTPDWCPGMIEDDFIEQVGAARSANVLSERS